MASLRTEITEITTGLGTLGIDTPETVFGSEVPPPELRNVDEPTWNRVRDAFTERRHQGEFLAAFNNGRAFRRASDGLRDRHPMLVEWKGPHRDPSDNPVPADLRIDHVYLVSCKYLSKVLHNASPWALFDRCLTGGAVPRGGDWFAEVAPAAHQQHYETVRRAIEHGDKLPQDATALSAGDRKILAAGREVRSPRTATAYRELANEVAAGSARRWEAALVTEAQRRAMLWRLLRLGAAPYFVLGTGNRENLRLRVATPWDWNQAWDLVDFSVSAEAAGQPRVRWSAVVRSATGTTPRPAQGEPDASPERETQVEGHVEVRWSHGRLAGSPEAKVYLDTPHRDVPGYIALR